MLSPLHRSALFAVVVSGVAAVLAIRHRLEEQLSGLVSYSSRLIAAVRAEESERPDALVVDPLAALLAGPKALAEYKVRHQKLAEELVVQLPLHNEHVQQQEEPSTLLVTQNLQRLDTSAAGQQQALHHIPDGQPHRRTSVSRIIARTLWFDHAVTSATSGHAQSALFKDACSASAGECRQVVLVGAGMDTRPWRLSLPPGVAWFEVDRMDVLTAKQRLLSRAGATFNNTAQPSGSRHTPTAVQTQAGVSQTVTATSATAPAAAVPCTEPPASRHSNRLQRWWQRRQSGGNQQPAAYPLACQSWAAVARDVQVPGWTEGLLAAGYDVRLKTVWVLEGLLYYLQPETVPMFLQEMASISAPGSWLTASIISIAQLERVQQRSAARPVKERGIMGEWTWGCPGSAAQYFGAAGWRVLSHPTWMETAAALDLQPEGVRRTGDNVQLLTALLSSNVM